MDVLEVNVSPQVWLPLCLKLLPGEVRSVRSGGAGGSGRGGGSAGGSRQGQESTGWGLGKRVSGRGTHEAAGIGVPVTP